MFERTVSSDAYFLPGPGELDPDEPLNVGLRWLLAQPGEPLVVLSRKGNLSNNRILEQTVKRHRITVAAPPRVHEPRWSGGSILVVWAGERALLDVDDYLVRSADAVCVIGWADGEHDTWIAGHASVSRSTTSRRPSTAWLRTDTDWSAGSVSTRTPGGWPMCAGRRESSSR